MNNKAVYLQQDDWIDELGDKIYESDHPPSPVTHWFKDDEGKWVEETIDIEVILKNEAKRDAIWLYNISVRARKKGIPFQLALNDLHIPTHCPILDIPLVRHGPGLFDDMPSIDRVIPELGYVPNNVNIISWKANRLKNNATLEEVKKILKYMQKNLSLAITNKTV